MTSRLHAPASSQAAAAAAVAAAAAAAATSSPPLCELLLSNISTTVIGNLPQQDEGDGATAAATGAAADASADEKWCTGTPVLRRMRFAMYETGEEERTRRRELEDDWWAEGGGARYMEALMERLKPLDAGMVMRRCQASVAEEEEGGLGGMRMHGAATDPEWENKRTMEDGGRGGGANRQRQKRKAVRNERRWWR